MKLFISVLGGSFETITKLIDDAIGEKLIADSTDYDANEFSGMITVTTGEKDVEKLVKYIWRWLPRSYKEEHDIRFYKEHPPNYNMRLLNHMLW